MTTDEDIAAEWVGFADTPENDRVSGMRTRLNVLAAESEEARIATLKAILAAELALDNARLETPTIGRFRAWGGHGSRVGRHHFRGHPGSARPDDRPAGHA